MDTLLHVAPSHPLHVGTPTPLQGHQWMHATCSTTSGLPSPPVGIPHPLHSRCPLSSTSRHPFYVGISFPPFYHSIQETPPPLFHTVYPPKLCNTTNGPISKYSKLNIVTGMYYLMTKKKLSDGTSNKKHSLIMRKLVYRIQRQLWCKKKIIWE